MPPILKQYTKWFIICTFSAVISLFLAYPNHSSFGNIAAMVLGIATFATGYTFLERQKIIQAWLGHLTNFRRAVKTGFIIRMGFFLPPLLASFISKGAVTTGAGYFSVPDFWLGYFSMYAIGKLFGVNRFDDTSFDTPVLSPLYDNFLTYMTTLMQGLLLSFVLGILILILWGIFALVVRILKIRKPVS